LTTLGVFIDSMCRDFLSLWIILCAG